MLEERSPWSSGGHRSILSGGPLRWSIPLKSRAERTDEGHLRSGGHTGRASITGEGAWRWWWCPSPPFPHRQARPGRSRRYATDGRLRHLRSSGGPSATPCPAGFRLSWPSSTGSGGLLGHEFGCSVRRNQRPGAGDERTTAGAPIVGIGGHVRRERALARCFGGGVFSFGAAVHGRGRTAWNRPIVGMTLDPRPRHGWWPATAVSSHSVTPSSPWVDGLVSPCEAHRGHGFDVVSDGSRLGRPRLLPRRCRRRRVRLRQRPVDGSMGDRPLNAPVVGMVSTSTRRSFYERSSRRQRLLPRRRRRRYLRLRRRPVHGRRWDPVTDRP